MAKYKTDDWQIGLKHINQRAKKILETGQWSDCSFIVGPESRQERFQAHRLILAMASPVFEAMFYGSMADKEDKPIEILDIQPQAFKAVLDYIYSDNIDFPSFEDVCEICYTAKKYMIPPLVEECTKYIWKDLYPGNVCRAFAFVRLFEEPQLLEKCMKLITTLTDEVVSDSTFEEIDMPTMKEILSQDFLNIGELQLWDGVFRWSKQECIRQSLEVTAPNQRKVMEELLPHFRFLTMSPTQFANGPALSNVLTQEECFGFLMNISSPGVAPLPPNFSDNTNPRKPASLQRNNSIPRDVDSAESDQPLECICADLLTDIFINDQLVDCNLSFSVNTEIHMVGIILPTQFRTQDNCGIQRGSAVPPPEGSRNPVNPEGNSRPIHFVNRHRHHHHFHHHPPLLNRYPELIYAFLQDNDGCRLTYTHFSARVSWENTMEVVFNRPIYIKPNETYNIVVVLNKMGRYPLYTMVPRTTVYGVEFSFENNSNRESIVKSLIFRTVNTNTASNSSNQKANEYVV